MPDNTEKRDKVKKTLDLSTGKPGRKKVTAGMAAPVIQVTIDLSTQKVKANEDASTTSEEPARPTSTEKTSKGPSPRNRKSPGGASLAELLDPETLGRLKGDAE